MLKATATDKEAPTAIIDRIASRMTTNEREMKKQITASRATQLTTPKTAAAAAEQDRERDFSVSVFGQVCCLFYGMPRVL